MGCTTELFEQDVKRLEKEGALSSEVSDRFAEFRARDFTAHAATLKDEWRSLMKVDNYAQMKFLWQSTRLCPRCSLAIEKSEGCNSFFCICGHHFDFASAPRVIGDGIEKFDQLISTAIAWKLDFEDVEKYGTQGAPWRNARAIASWRQVKRLVAEHYGRLSREEAWQLLQKAKSGDEQAREKIRWARHRREVTAEEEFDEDIYDWFAYCGFDLWEDSSKEDEDVQPPSQNSTIAFEPATDEVTPSIAIAAPTSETLQTLSEKLLKHAYIKAVCETKSEVMNASS